MMDTVCQRYSVMRSDGNRFCGNVVLDSFHMVYRHDDSVLDQKFEKQISRDCYYKDFKVIEENAYLKKYST